MSTTITRPNRLTMQQGIEAYGTGGAKGHQVAEEWLSNPRRTNPQYGGTLQYVILDMAERMRNAQNKEEIERIRGEIVGFCYRVECPADAIECAKSAAAKRA